MDIFEQLDFTQLGGTSTTNTSSTSGNKLDFSGLLDKGKDKINNFTGGLNPVKTEIAPSQSMIILVVAILGCIMYNQK
tara:strand:+ start:4450 stop:4683 length:234 start_codon:yes stop_codon:yes gene_type:complete